VESKSSTDQSSRRRIFFRAAAAAAFNVQFFDAIEFIVFISFSIKKRGK